MIWILKIFCRVTCKCKSHGFSWLHFGMLKFFRTLDHRPVIVKRAVIVSKYQPKTLKSEVNCSNWKEREVPYGLYRLNGVTFLPAALLCLFIIAFFRFPSSSAANILLNSNPKSTSSPHPPHLKSPWGVSFGNAPQLHFVVIPILHARASAWVKDADAMA